MTSFDSTEAESEAEWELVYEYLVQLKVGDTVTYEDLDGLLDRRFKDSRTPFLKANIELLRSHQRGLTNVRNVGYRVVSAQEHEHLARNQHRAARRRLNVARRWVANTDRSQLDDIDKARFDAMELSLSRQIDFTKGLATRVTRVEAALEQAQNNRNHSDEELRARMDRLTESLRRQGFTVDEEGDDD